MRVRRRLTALIAGLVLLPSLAAAGQGCGMPAGAPASGLAVAATPAEHDHAAHSEHEAPTGAPHAPMQCVSAATCAAAVVVTPTAPLAGLLRDGDRVVGDAMLAPAAPALAPEPPPPRA
jgi:hypothetical protein